MHKISLVIPVYFNEGSLNNLFKELEKLENQLYEKTFC